ELRPLPLLAGTRLTARPAVAKPRRAEVDVTVYTDGACSGNPGAGGWAAILIDGDPERVVSGSAPHTTNQRMELQAVAEGLAAVPAGRRVHIYSDSAYIVNCFREGWWERWQKNGWRNSQKQPVAKRDLWGRIRAENRRPDVGR